MIWTLRSWCRPVVLSALILVPSAARATEHAANGWRVKKWSRELWTACGLVVRYYVEVQRTGPALAGVIPFSDYRSSAYSEKYLNETIVTDPALAVQAGDTNLNLDLLAVGGVPQGQTYSIQYDVRMKNPLSPGFRVRNYFIANPGTSPSNDLSVAYDVWVKLVNGHGRSRGARVGEPVDAATGEFFLPPETDLDLGGPLPLRFTRWYGSALNDPWFNHVNSALGRNWMHSFDVRQLLNGTGSRFVVHENGKIVDFTSVTYLLPTPSNAWVRNFEQEPVPYEFKSDGNATGTNFWFRDPAQELLYRFDNAPTSFVKEIVDRNGHALHIRRRADGLVTNVSDGLGRNLFFEYSASSNLVRVTDGTRAVSFGQDANGFLVAATNALGEATRYAYDPVNSFLNGNQALMVSVQHPRGNVPYVQAYDTNGLVVGQTDAYGHASAFEYVPGTDGWTRVTDPEGVLETRQYANRLPTNFLDQAGHSFQQTYDGRDRPTRFTDRRGFESRLAFAGDAGQPSQFVAANGRTTEFSYVWTTQTFTNAEFPARTVQFAFQDLARIDYPDGTVERFDRDGRGNVTSHLDRVGNRWNYVYDERGQLVAAERPEGGTETFAYNADGTLASAADSDTDPVAFGYDALRRRISAAYPGGRVESWGYDALDRVVAATNGYGAASAFEYDANGILVRARDSAGFEVVRQTDLLDRTTNSADSLGPLESATYDAMGRLAAATDPAGATAYAYDLRGWPVAATRAGRTRQWQYDADGHVTNFVSPLGHSVAVQRDALGAPTEVVDALGCTNRLAYDAMGRLVSATDPLGRATGYGYDEAGRLVSVTNALGAEAAALRDADGRVQFQTDFDGNLWTFAYTPMGRLAAAIDPLAQIAQYAYDEAGRLAERGLPDGTRETWTYDALDHVSEKSDRATNSWTYGYDELGRLVAATNPAGGIVRRAYNLDGTIDSISDSDLGPVSNRYDAARRLVQILLPGGAAAAFAYNEHGEIVSATDENGSAAVFEYDADGRLVAETDPDGNQARCFYDAAGEVTGAVDRVGGVYAYEYDAAGQLVRETDPGGVETAYAYDAAGRRTETTVAGRTWRIDRNASGAPTNSATPLGRASRAVLDALHRPVAVADPLGRTNEIAYDEMGRVVSVRDPLGHERTFAYESRGLLAAAGGTGLADAIYEYDALGELARLTDPGGHAWTFGNSPMGARLSAADPLGRTNAFAYDARGRLARATFADGAWAEPTCDPAGNVTGVVHSTGASFRFAYDACGRLAAADGLALRRDAEGRVTNTVCADDGRGFSAAYDAAGRIVSAGYDNGSFQVRYAYDPQSGLLTNVNDTLSGAAVAFAYDGDFRPVGLARANGVDTTRAFDDADQIVRLAHGTVADLTYEYDAAGRLTKAAGTVPVGAFGAIATAATGATFDAAAQISSAGCAFDPRGRQTAAPGHAFAWDGASRIVGLDGAALAYDGLDNLATRTVGAATTRYYRNLAFPGAPIAAERDETAGVFARYYVWTPEGTLLYLVDVAAGNAPRYFHFDRMGNTLALTDAAGHVTDAYAYSPFGELLARTGGSPQPFTFGGEWGVRQEDADGTLYQMRARTYDARSGRFLSPDPLWPGDDPHDLNPYAYARNNPLSFLDPDGTTTLGLPPPPPPLPIPVPEPFILTDGRNVIIDNMQDILDARAANARADEEIARANRRMIRQSSKTFKAARPGASLFRGAAGKVVRGGVLFAAAEVVDTAKWWLLDQSLQHQDKLVREFKQDQEAGRQARRKLAEDESQRDVEKWWRETGRESTDRFIRERAERARRRLAREYRRPAIFDVGALVPPPDSILVSTPGTEFSPFRVSQGVWSTRNLTAPIFNGSATVQTPSASVAAPVGKSYCHQQPRNTSPRFGCGFQRHSRNGAGFLEDTWTISDKLTRNAGVRFEKEDGRPPAYGAPTPYSSPPINPPDFSKFHLDPRIFRLGAKVEW